MELHSFPDYMAMPAVYVKGSWDTARRHLNEHTVPHSPALEGICVTYLKS